MSKTTRAITILTASAALALGAVACEQGQEEAQAPEATEANHPQLGERLLQHVDLDANQQEQLAELRSRLDTELATTTAAVTAKREELRELWAAATPDRGAILAATEELATLQASARTQRMEAHQALQGILTDEQRNELAEQGPMRRFRGHFGGAEGAEEGAPGRFGRGKQGRRFRRGPGQIDGGEGRMHRRGPGQLDDGEGRMHRRGRGFGRGMGDGENGHGLLGRGLARRLNLDESQQAQVQALRQTQREQLAPTREQIRELRTQLRAAHMAGEPDAAAIEALQAQLAPLERTLREAQVDFRLSLIELLNAEQRAQLAELPMLGGRGGAGMGGRRGRGMHGQRGMGGRGFRGHGQRGLEGLQGEGTVNGGTAI